MRSIFFLVVMTVKMFAVVISTDETNTSMSLLYSFSSSQDEQHVKLWQTQYEDSGTVASTSVVKETVTSGIFMMTHEASGLSPATTYGYIVEVVGEGNSTEDQHSTTHTWDGLIGECATNTLGKPKGTVLKRTELQTISSFSCSYSGEADIEVICDLTGATKIDMRGNWIRQNIPACIGGLTSLTELDFSGNRMRGHIPAELTTLANLEKLDLSNNEFQRLPAGIENMTALKELHVSFNQLTQKIPPELGSLPNIERIYLQGNRLHGEIPAELGNLSKLQKLRLNENTLKGEIPNALADLNLTSPNGLGLHENCRLTLTFPDCNASDVNDTADCTLLAESNETRAWIDAKASLYRGYDGVQQTGGNCWGGWMVPIITYLLSPTELVTSGTFDSDDGSWTVENNWTIVGGWASNNSGTAASIYQDINTDANQTYYISFDANVTSGTVAAKWRDINNTDHTIAELNATGSFDGNYTTVDSNGHLYFVGGDCAIDNISVKDGL